MAPLPGLGDEGASPRRAALTARPRSYRCPGETCDLQRRRQPGRGTREHRDADWHGSDAGPEAAVMPLDRRLSVAPMMDWTDDQQIM